MFSAKLVAPAIGDAFRKLSPRQLIKNPVLFTTAVVALLLTVLLVAGGDGLAISFQLHFPSGVVAQCMSSYRTANGNRARAYGDKGLLDLEPATAYEGQRLFVEEKSGRTERAISAGNQFAAMMDHFSECVQENKDPKITGEDGLRDVRYINAIYESSRSNGAPVEVKGEA